LTPGIPDRRGADCKLSLARGDLPGFPRVGSEALERDIVVQVVDVLLGRRRARRFAAGARAAFALRRRLAATAAATGAATEHLHAIGDDFGRVLFLSFLVLPLARLQPALHIYLAAFFQIFAGDLGELAEKRDPVPF